MRIGIFNLYWNTRGGGELHAGAMAEYLGRGHQVELIACEPVDVQELSDSLGLDLSRASFRQWPAAGPRQLSELTAGYDLFINSTFWSPLPSRARRSAYLVFFPRVLAPRWKVRLAETGERWTKVPAPVAAGEGFYGPEFGRYQWSRGEAVLTLRPRAFRGREARVRLLDKGPLPPAAALSGAEGPGLEWRVEGNELILTSDAAVERPVDVRLVCRTFSPSEIGESGDTRRLGVCLDLAQRGGRLARLSDRVHHRLRGYIDHNRGEFVSTYDQLIANSQYTSKWIARRWGRSSAVLPPPVDTETFTPPPAGEKRRVILSVGRFFYGVHNKKHLEMLRAFRRMCDRGEIPAGWEFHLAGRVHRERLVHLDYYADLERLARGYPVRLMPDLPFAELLREYRSAAVFWHAAGWGENDRRHPDNFEHFGLTTCEAMASGCIPVVIAKAGQLETVRDELSGFLFRDERELVARTRQLIAGFGEPWAAEMMQRAVEDARRYGRQAFDHRLATILEEARLLC